MKKRHFAALTTIIAGLFSIAPSCYAGLVIVQFTAEVTGVSDTYNLLQGGINLGDTITGTYTYDTSAPDLNPWPRWARYEYDTPPSGISVRLGRAGGGELRTDPDNTDFSIEIVNDTPAAGGSWDAFTLVSENNMPFVGDLVIDAISLDFFGLPALALSSDALPVDAPEIADWLTAKVFIIGFEASGSPRGPSFGITGDLTSAVLIPEPATLGLLGFGGLVMLRRHSRAGNG